MAALMMHPTSFPPLAFLGCLFAGVRLFSIDGCHSARATRGDLRLAAASLAGRIMVNRDAWSRRPARDS